MANFQTESGIPGERFAPALNGCLPGDLRILESSEAPPGFHARYSATRKTYEYLVYRRTEGAVMHRDHALVLTEALDLDAMREAAAYLAGSHRFKSFCASGSGVKRFVRTVGELTVEEWGEWLKFTVTADGFLYHMVRNVVGDAAAGRGRQDFTRGGQNHPGVRGPHQGGPDRAGAGAVPGAGGVRVRVRIIF